MMKSDQSRRWLNVIILHWEDSKGLVRCLNHLAQSDYPCFRVLVIENASSSEHRRQANLATLESQEKFAWVHLLQNESNLGYAGGNNAGLTFLNRERLTGDICVLNPDVAVGVTTLSVMMAARIPDVGVVMCSAISEQDEVLYDRFILRGYRQTCARSVPPVTETDYAQGACLIVNREAVKDSLFDARFFLYWEEVDLSLRLRKKGYKLISCTDAPIVRTVNHLSRLPTAIYYSARNGWLLRKKHPAQFTTAGYLFYVVHLALVTLKLVHRPALFFAAWTSLYSSLLDAYAGRYGIRVSRRTAKGMLYTLNRGASR